MDSPKSQPKIERQQSNQRIDDKNEAQDQLKGQVSRRSRKDTQGRDFVCGCGKKYLSYPALYTHIKTKHQGHQPQGTVKYSTTAPAKKSKTKLQQQHLSELSSLLKKQDLKLVSLIPQKLLGWTPLPYRLKQKILSKQLSQCYQSMLKSPINPSKLNKQSSLEMHLIAFLVCTGQHITEKLHQQYQWFAKTVRDCYYHMGIEVYNKCFSKKDGGLCYIPKFKIDKVKYFPIICDFYIRFYLPYEYPQINFNLMELILTDFCNWLISRKCTFIQVILNKQYKLTNPLEFEEEDKNEKRINKDQEEEEKCDQSEPQQNQSQARQNHHESSRQNNEQANNKPSSENGQYNNKSQQHVLDQYVVSNGHVNHTNHIQLQVGINRVEQPNVDEFFQTGQDNITNNITQNHQTLIIQSSVPALQNVQTTNEVQFQNIDAQEKINLQHPVQQQ